MKLYALLIIYQALCVSAFPPRRPPNLSDCPGRLYSRGVSEVYNGPGNGLVQILPPPTRVPATSGSFISSLEKSGRTNQQPFPTKPISSPVSLLVPTPSDFLSLSGSVSSSPQVTVSESISISGPQITTEVSIDSSIPGDLSGSAISTSLQDETSLEFPAAPTAEDTASTMAQAPISAPSANVFTPIDTGAPPAAIGQRADHPVPRLSILPQKEPIPTNKFYANFFLASQTQPTWTHPYSVSWSKGGGSVKSWGLSVSHIDANQRAFAPGNPPSQYFLNPNGIQSIILSAKGLLNGSTITLDTLKAFSVNVNLRAKASDAAHITFPLVQGMGFVTARYGNLTPVVQTGVYFRTVTRDENYKPSGAKIIKYKLLLEDGKTWLLYATPKNGADNFELTVVNNGLLQAQAPFLGTVQVAKNPGGAAGEAIYDASAGVYPTQAEVSGTASGTVGSYTLKWTKGGVRQGASLLMYALPHHVQSFDAATKGAVKNINLQTTTKGVATGVVRDSWTLTESNLPVSIGFAPWNPQLNKQSPLSASVVQLMNTVAVSEVSQDMNAQTNLDSMYFSGKGLSKFATLIYTIHDLGNNTALAQKGLAKLKTAFAVFVNNKQKYPLAYETAWKGIVSTGSYVTGDSGQDFGNTYYNDHHFHYAYFIHAAAIIGYLDPSWLPANKAYINALVRDAANPSSQDPYFPISRSFDWYHGHSWAKGLFESGDGKDEESSSEDTLFAYAIKMWGKTIGDRNMEARGNLMLSILSRSLQNYFLMESNNVNQPAQFIGNKVTGIIFENKADHATYFGTNIEFIQGIHMIPLLPNSAFTRHKNFVREEWATYFDKGRADKIVGGWRGILYANLALIDPRSSYNFFAQNSFDASWLDPGASRTWYLAYAAGLGGAP